MARELTPEEAVAFRVANEVWDDLTRTRSDVVRPAALTDEAAFAQLVDESGNLEVALTVVSKPGGASPGEPNGGGAPDGPVVDAYRLEYEPFSGALPSMETYLAMTEAERDVVETVRAGGERTLAEEMQLVQRWADASQLGAQQRMQLAEQERLAADPQHQAFVFAERAMRSAQGRDKRGLVELVASLPGVLDMSDADPARWSLTEMGRKALGEGAQAEHQAARVAAAVSQLRAVERAPVGISRGFDAGEARVEFAPAAPTE